MENKQEKSQEEMVKEAVEEARKAAEETAEEETAQETAEEAAEETAEETAQETSEEASEEAADSEKAEEGSEEKKKFFGKKKKDKKDEKIEELTDKSQMYEVGAKDIIEKILPVVDNFERGLAAVTEEEKENAFVQGMEKVYKQLMTTLEGIEVKPIEAVGKEFDPNFHNAVMHVEDENLGENIVAEEFQKGYLYRDSVVRHSMVKVAN